MRAHAERGDAAESRTEVTIDADLYDQPEFVPKSEGIHESYMASRMRHPIVPRRGRVMQHNDPEPDGERGVIVNTASIAAFDGQIGQAAYAASKGGVVSLTLPLAREFASFGVRVVCIAPGVFETPMVASLTEPVRAGLQNQQPFPNASGSRRSLRHSAATSTKTPC
jgi:NAD(P)-dependent dehydrogenase (short-subunit alcohol dehydrogenase family)